MGGGGEAGVCVEMCVGTRQWWVSLCSLFLCVSLERGLIFPLSLFAEPENKTNRGQTPPLFASLTRQAASHTHCPIARGQESVPLQTSNPAVCLKKARASARRSAFASQWTRPGPCWREPPIGLGPAMEVESL